MVQLVMENIRLTKKLILLTFYILKVIIKETSILTILFHDIQARRTCHAESKGTVRNPESQRMKITPQRLEVYRAFTGPEEHPTATEIYEKCGSRCPP